MKCKEYLFTCNNFEGFYPVGTAATVIASKAFVARNRLNKELLKHGLPGKVETKDMVILCPVTDWHLKRDTVRILCNGNY